MKQWNFWQGALIRWRLSTVLEAEKVNRRLRSLTVFFDREFSFCEQSNMSPCCEFLVVACFNLFVNWSKEFFSNFGFRDWGTPKNYPPTTIFFCRWWIKKCHMLACGSARKRKKRRRPGPFLFTSATKLLSLCKCALQEFFPFSFSRGGLLQAL